METARELFKAEGMLFHASYSGHCVVDRFPMNSHRVAKAKNMRERWQVVNAEQTQCKTFRNVKDALNHCYNQGIISDVCRGYVSAQSVYRHFMGE
jgi:hypothetical protein